MWFGKLKVHKMIVKIATALLFYLSYWLVCFLCIGTDKKNLAGLRSYPDNIQQAFLFAFGEGIGVFGLVIIDLLWWRNTKRIRFSFLPEKADYKNLNKHIGSFLRKSVIICSGRVFYNISARKPMTFRLWDE